MTREEFIFENLAAGAVLDVGNLGSQGRIHKMLIDKLGSEKVFGLDTADQSEAGCAFKNQHLGTAEAMPFPNEMFDVLYLGEILEHSWQPKKIMDECIRVLKSGGILIMDVPNIYSFSRMLKYLLTGKDIIIGDPDHKIFYSWAMLFNLAEKSGFGVLELISDRLCTVKGKNFWLPDFGAFKYMGEHLLLAARKLK